MAGPPLVCVSYAGAPRWAVRERDSCRPECPSATAGLRVVRRRAGGAVRHPHFWVPECGWATARPRVVRRRAGGRCARGNPAVRKRPSATAGPGVVRRPARAVRHPLSWPLDCGWATAGLRVVGRRAGGRCATHIRS
ncbi:hypothetical protein AAII07_03595 [Microvirga sp. 0TCS3.31]